MPALGQRKYRSIEHWIEARTEKRDCGYSSPCWVWIGRLNEKGYARSREPGARPGSPLVRVHRVSYETHVGPIPSGLQIDHLCRTKACVNPAHLEPVTNAENQRRAMPFRALARGPRYGSGFCRNGHEVAPGSKCCRVCRNAYMRAWNARTGAHAKRAPRCSVQAERPSITNQRMAT